MNITASAPGKLVLLGEYAVLEGAPAISMAVDRRAIARLKPRLSPRYDAYAPDILDVRVPFQIDSNGVPSWPEGGDAATRLSLVDQVLRGLADEQIAPASGGHGFGLELDTHEFFYALGAEPLKLGLGSSAALTVALATALVAHAGRGAVSANRRVWLQRLLALHRKFQGGHGSGVDVATSLIGGVISYQLVGDEHQPLARELVWPSRIQRLYVWSGRSASTSQALARLQVWRSGHGTEYTVLMRDLTAIAESAVAALEGADASGFIDAATAYARGLRRFGEACGLEIFSAEHDRIAEIARAAGLLYKPCGAGVGDVGVVFALDDGERLEAVRRTLYADGFATVPLAVDETGLRLEFTEIDEA
jgi:phosphomevalonate kinase